MKLILVIIATFSIALCGCPKPPPPTPIPPSTNLSWSDKDAPYIATYRILRSNVSGGPYTLILIVPGTSLTAKDTNVAPGQTWYYRIAAVDFQGDVSNFSNEQSHTIPLGGTTNEVASIRIPRRDSFIFTGERSKR